MRSGVTLITLHGLRDIHASLCKKAEVPIEVISKRLGHAGIGVTVERYLHVYSDRDAARLSVCPTREVRERTCADVNRTQKPTQNRMSYFTFANSWSTMNFTIKMDTT